MTECRTHNAVEPTADAAQDIDTLYFFTYCFATTAVYAFVRVAHDCYAAVVHWECALFAGKANFANPHLMSQLLQLAVAAAHAVQAVSRMVGQQQFYNAFSCFTNFCGVGEHFQTFSNWIYAGRLQCFGTFYFNQTYAACAQLVYIFQVTQCWNINTGFLCSLQYGRTCFNLHGNAIDYNIYHFHKNHPFYYALEIAPNLHFSIQVPHLIHFVVSILCGSLTVPSIAPTGQLRAQAVQPLHFAGSIS